MDRKVRRELINSLRIKKNQRNDFHLDCGEAGGPLPGGSTISNLDVGIIEVEIIDGIAVCVTIVSANAGMVEMLSAIT